MGIDYADISQTYDEHRSFSKHLVDKVAEFGGIQEGMKALDVGCGTGNLASQLLDMMNLDMIGVDISLSMLEVARGKSLEVICTDAANNRLPFCDSCFDIITATYVIHQISNLELLFSECYRVLRDGALVLLTSSHEQIENEHPVFKRFFPGAIDVDKARFPDIPVICEMLVTAGFHDIRQESVLGASILIDDEYLQKVKGKYVSTYRLLPQREFERGVAELETYIKNLSQPESTVWRGTLIYGRKKG
ncbi:MAG: methyltransferase domain-containing protein [Dehalococcoidales bacterium]|nr:MAG: methyltransferase domain-containing protein [Dehalococcoidales bacterium]